MGSLNLMSTSTSLASPTMSLKRTTFLAASSKLSQATIFKSDAEILCLAAASCEPAKSHRHFYLNRQMHGTTSINY